MMNDLQIGQTLTFLIRELFSERGMNVAPPTADSDRSNQKLWDTFRALVNTRQPMPASPEFLAEQDKLLRAMIERAGVATVDKTWKVPANDRMRLWRGDITTLAADAIVNAANSQMLGCWVPGHYCIDNAIHTFAGVQLRIECARIMGEQGFEEPTGLAKITPAYNLPSKHILHTVGPIVNGGKPTAKDRELLASCYTSCLDLGWKMGCKSIAFCCISTGVFGFPQKEAARIAVKTVQKWLDAHPEADVTVIFNVYLPEDERIYRKLLNARL